jgi:hypothetical protein
MESKESTPVRVELTDEQKAKLNPSANKDSNAAEYEVEELEERIAPVAFTPIADV